jgi:transcription elongation factor GreA
MLQDTPTQLEKPGRSRQVATLDAVPLTAAAREVLERELADLRAEKRREIPARLRRAREFGDNDDEYFAVREEEAVLDARIARVEDILTRATAVDRGAADDLVAVGSEVAVADVQTGETREYVIESAHGTLSPRTISPGSPVGQALLGRRAGERVGVKLPTGRRRELELRTVRASSGA